MPIEVDQYKKTTKLRQEWDKNSPTASKLDNFSLADGSVGISALYAAAAGVLLRQLESLSDWRAERRALKAVPGASHNSLTER